LGRFVSADPIVPEPGNPQALNRYAYVLGNPIKYRDPTGHAFIEGTGGGGGYGTPWVRPYIHDVVATCLP